MKLVLGVFIGVALFGIAALPAAGSSPTPDAAVGVFSTASGAEDCGLIICHWACSDIPTSLASVCYPYITGYCVLDLKHVLEGTFCY